MEFCFRSNSVKNSWKCLKSNSLSHCLTEFFQIYQKYIGPSDGGTIIPSTHRPTVLYWRMSDFKSFLAHKSFHVPELFSLREAKPFSAQFVLWLFLPTFLLIYQAKATVFFYLVILHFLSCKKTCKPSTLKSTQGQ